MALKYSKWIPVATIVMSIPLLLSYNIKYVAFPEGMPYVFLFTWGLLSVFILPLLLFAEFILIVHVIKSPYSVNQKPLLVLNILATAIASIAELTFVIVRYR